MRVCCLSPLQTNLVQKLASTYTCDNKVHVVRERGRPFNADTFSAFSKYQMP